MAWCLYLYHSINIADVYSTAFLQATLRNTCLTLRVFEEAQVGLVTFKHSAGSSLKQKVRHMSDVGAFLTTDGEPQLHSSFLRQLDVESATARHH